MKILVTDGENRSALAAARSLGRKGYLVAVTSIEDCSLAACSKYCYKAFKVPGPLREADKYSKAIAKIALAEGIGIILPMTDMSVSLLAPARRQLPQKTILACPPAEKTTFVADKVNVFRLAESLGVAVPKTLYIDNPRSLCDRLNEIEAYPVVVKPGLSKIRDGQKFISGGICYANNPSELLRLYATQPSLSYLSMIQEKIVGPGTGLFTLFDGNRHLALFSHRRLREKPPSGGVSVVSESVPLDQEMVQAAQRLLSAVSWQGVAMVEFKRDLRDGRAKLMEINGRFWGTLQLAIACGVDFPALYLDFLQEKTPSGVLREYRVGHKMKWFFGTLDHLLIRLKNNDGALNLPPGSPSKAGAVVDFLKIWEKDTSFDVFDWNDLGPFLFEASNYFKR